MFLVEEVSSRLMTLSVILDLLAKHDAPTFTTPLKLSFLRNQYFRLQADGGANRLFTNNIYYFNTSWEITPYTIGSIGDGIVCTSKHIFHLICDDRSVIPITMFYSKIATKTVISPTDTVCEHPDQYDS